MTSLGDEIVLTTRFDEAFRYAHGLHQNQLRKGTVIPYISHLMAVSALVVEHGGGEDGTRWYYRALANCFTNTMPGRLSDRLSRAVASFSD
jgi:(p)ppGpp synthase/HD superfamily hydrolase